MVKIGSSCQLSGTVAGTGRYRESPPAIRSSRRRTVDDLADRGGEDRVGAAHGADQPGAREQVGDVVLAEVDEAEAEGQRVGPGDRALALFASESDFAPTTEVAKWSEGIAAQGLPPSAL